MNVLLINIKDAITLRGHIIYMIKKNRKILPFVKYNMVPMFILRTIGYIFLIIVLILTDKICQCVHKALHEEDALGNEGSGKKLYCSATLAHRTEQLLIFFMACEILFPFLTLIVITRHTIYKLYRPYMHIL